MLEGSDIPSAVPPFLACGDLSGWDESEQVMMDADKSYPIEQDYVAPIAPPILPPHKAQTAEKANVSLRFTYNSYLDTAHISSWRKKYPFL